MKKVLVTGCAGFIGSSLAIELLKRGENVLGVDCLTNNYTRIKHRNIEELSQFPHFTWIKGSLLSLDLKQLLKDIEVIFHQAAIPGVRSSWGRDFYKYVQYNILATQKLLEAAKNSFIEKMIYASSSSIYGITSGKTVESQLPLPFSPYGVSKLAGEHLCQLYYKNYGLPVVSLRYFTVYGPKQRPDMAFHKFIRKILTNEVITIYGDGEQTRDYTYIADAVEANLLAMEYGQNGEVYNIGGNGKIQLLEVISKLSAFMNKEPLLHFIKAQPGDPKHTWADISKAREELGYHPVYPLEKGLQEQIAYLESLYSLNL